MCGPSTVPVSSRPSPSAPSCPSPLCTLYARRPHLIPPTRTTRTTRTTLTTFASAPHRPQKNSGIIGGKFLERCRVKKPMSHEYYSQADFYTGAMIEFNKFPFVLYQVHRLLSLPDPISSPPSLILGLPLAP